MEPRAYDVAAGRTGYELDCRFVGEWKKSGKSHCSPLPLLRIDDPQQFPTHAIIRNVPRRGDYGAAGTIAPAISSSPKNGVPMPKISRITIILVTGLLGLAGCQMNGEQQLSPTNCAMTGSSCETPDHR